jgi:alkylated DNA repair protein (DNA oxidative demethylase)
MTTLFDSDSSARSYEPLEEGAVLLRGFATFDARLLIDEVARIAQTAAFRHLVTPGGYTMSVAMTNCGRVGWVSDRTGYRYEPVDPDTGAPCARNARGIPRHRSTCRCPGWVRRLQP